MAILRARLSLACLTFLTATFSMTGCSTLPELAGRPQSTALIDTDDTRLGRRVVPLAASHPGTSGIFPLPDAEDAFAARILLARVAERSLDVQYYIWRNDITGTLLFDALRAAAERGVRVRLLLDDNNTSGLDARLAALDTHPNIEVRLFNPFANRSIRAIGYVTDFSRLNRRMHNKSFTADNQITLIGGRNVGDEYFGAGEGVQFADLDVIGVGPVSKLVSSDFDRYWASQSAYPVARLLPKAEPGALEELAADATQVAASPQAATYLEAVRQFAFVRNLMEGTESLEWATTRLVSDAPSKGLGKAGPEQILSYKLEQIIGMPSRSLSLVSPYFVPGKHGTKQLVDLASQGVEIRALTNSLEATDVAAVHAGYAKRRKTLLKAGVHLYESRHRMPPPKRDKGKGKGKLGSSLSSLHAKTFAFDGAHIFVGSFNFDPRSAYLNTEMGLIIDSSNLAGRVDQAFEANIPQTAYEVILDEEGKMVWLERHGDVLERHTTEPGTSAWQRMGVNLMSLLPIDWLL